MGEHSNLVDITPTPKILRTLGDIPFDIWQCFAELADNSIDAFKKAEESGVPVDCPRVDIHWSADAVASMDREIIIEDNGHGMTLDVLCNAAKAGFTSNDPIHNLGLFGMGFNISTARLGEETLFLTAMSDTAEWVGIRINFEELIKSQSFSAPIVTLPKSNENESGTKVVIRKLKEGILPDLKRKTSQIRRRLESVYSPILEKNKVNLYVQGTRLSPHPHCVWGESRFVMRKGVRVEAVQRIDRDLGEVYFDISRNRYLSDDEGSEVSAQIIKDGSLPVHVMMRSRRLKGWLGIQRYSDTAEFGVDFIRNGRKILVSDKGVFGYENPETGSIITEYPIELGSTMGGRIVGEIHVDYLTPTYQKNGFDTSDLAWRLTIEAIRGAGPILPKKRSALGYDGGNASPLGMLINAFRRMDQGTKCLAISNSIAKEFARNFRSGDPEFQSDDKWYKAAQEADRAKGEGGKTSPVNSGSSESDDVDSYGPVGGGAPVVHPPSGSGATAGSISESTKRDELIKASERMESLTSKYVYGGTPPIEVTAWKVNSGQIKVNGERVPCTSFQDGIEVDFFFDITHSILAEYPLSPKQLLLIVMAEKFATRDPGLSIQRALYGLIENHLADERINASVLQERAQSLFSSIKDKLPSLLAHRKDAVLKVIKAVPAEEEELASTLIEEVPHILELYQAGASEATLALPYLPDAAVIRLVEAFPEEFLDKKLFDLPYQTILIGSDDAKSRLRKTSLDKVLSYLRDTVMLLQGARESNKHELIRNANTLAILENRIVP
jgi:hypothetical protein